MNNLEQEAVLQFRLTIDEAVFGRGYRANSTVPARSGSSGEAATMKAV